MIGEDKLVTSFAGQLDTILNVEGEGEVLEAVKQCWASVFNWRLWNYLTEHEALSSGTLLEGFSIAVVAQRMVDAKAAGAAFSADPVTGQRCVVIEAVHGLGEALVQGLAKPDRYVVDARGVLAEAQPAGAGTPALEENQILRLAEIVRKVASKTKDPQDIEWAWDGADFHLLQSRPITSLVGRRVYSNKMVSDMSPGLIKPLVYSTKTVAMAQNVFGRIFTELIGPNDIDFTLFTKRIHSRIYTDITMLGELFERVGLPANFFEMMSRDERADLQRPLLTLKTLRGMLRLASFAWRHSRTADEIATFLKRHDQELEHYRQTDWLSEDPQDLLAQFDQLVHLHSESQWYVFIGPMNMMVRNRLLNRLVSQRATDVVPSDLIRGLVGLKALEPNDELQKLAAQARALGAEIQRLLIEEDDKTIRKVLSTSDEGLELVRSVDAFLRHYGFLSPNGTDFTATPWAETPTLIWHAIGRSAASPMEPATENVEAVREEARRHVQVHLNRLHRMLFDRLLASTITYIDLREHTSLLMSEDSYQMRRIFLALADHLVARGDLDQRDDIFYLMYDELRQLVEGKLKANAAQELVTARKAEMEADAQVELPNTICGDHVPTRPILPVEGQEYLVGISGSSGLAQGYARIVLDPAAAPVTLTRSDILIVPFTDVGWTPLFSGIGGIVAETGGQLSHTSIVAREYGLPAVVSVKKATHLIKDGQPITVDGDTGRVYLKHMMDA
jgi:pyruvate,water dikinase